jgi:hypothetical protein
VGCLGERDGTLMRWHGERDGTQFGVLGRRRWHIEGHGGGVAGNLPWRTIRELVEMSGRSEDDGGEWASIDKPGFNAVARATLGLLCPPRILVAVRCAWSCEGLRVGGWEDEGWHGFRASSTTALGSEEEHTRNRLTRGPRPRRPALVRSPFSTLLARRKCRPTHRFSPQKS